MAVVEWTDVVGKLPAPELATVPADAQEDILEYVHATINVAIFGGEASARLRRARMLLAAHLATVIIRGPIAGPVIAETSSKISRQYAQMFMNKNFTGSKYGLEYADMVRATLGARIF